MNGDRFTGRVAAIKSIVDGYNEYDDIQKQAMIDLVATYPGIGLDTPSSTVVVNFKTFNVKKIKKYDVIKVQANTPCPHYSVVIGIDNNKVYCVHITSKEKAFSDEFLIAKNRAFEGSYFCSHLSVVYLEEAKENFCFNYSEGRKEFREVVSKIKEKYQKLLQ